MSKGGTASILKMDFDWLVSSSSAPRSSQSRSNLKDDPGRRHNAIPMERADTDFILEIRNKANSLTTSLFTSCCLKSISSIHLLHALSVMMYMMRLPDSSGPTGCYIGVS